MTSQVFHLIMLLSIGAITFVSWHGYESSVGIERRVVLRWNLGAAIWFLYLMIVAAPGLSDFVPAGLSVAGFVFVINLWRLMRGLVVILRRLARGADYLFVKHPAERPVAAAMTGAPVDGKALAAALTPDPRDIQSPRQSAYHYAHQAEKARHLKDQLDAEAEVAEAAIRLEQARAKRDAIMRGKAPK